MFNFRAMILLRLFLVVVEKVILVIANDISSVEGVKISGRSCLIIVAQ